MRPCVVHPRLIDDVLVNPNMGIETFQRFNGDALNPPGTWSEFGPEEFPHAGDPPADEWEPAPGFPASTIAYCRWYWASLAPAPGVYRLDVIENACASAAARGQTLNLRLMPHNGKTTVPAWYRRLAKGRSSGLAGKTERWIPDYEDPAYLEHFGGLVRAAGERFDGDPRINMIDVGMFGHWGEFHLLGELGRCMPSIATMIRGVDLLIDAWPRTPKAMLLRSPEEPEVTRHACARGCGWRADCWGDMGGFDDSDQAHDRWCHMLDSYPLALCAAGVQEAWRRGPVALEVCWTMKKWREEGWDVDYIVDQALRWHVTSVNLKSDRVPDDWWPAIRHLQRRMGYRIALRRAQFPPRARPGERIEVRLTFENRGVAPPYHGYPPALALATAEGEVVQRLELGAETRSWVPGYHDLRAEWYLPPGLAPGDYELLAGLLCPHERRPRVRLANEGRRADGWYRLGRIAVGN